MNLGWAVGPLIGALFIPLYGFQMLFYFGMIISVVCLVVRFLFLHEPSRRTTESKRSILVPKFDRNLAYFVAGCSMFGFASGLFSPVIAPYAEKVLKLSLVEIELMGSMAQFATSLVSVLGGIFVGRVGGKRGLATSFICCGLGVAIWSFSSSFLVATVLMAFFLVFKNAFYEVAYGTVISSLTIPKNRATTFGVTAVIVGLLTAGGSATGGYLWELYAPNVPFLLTAVLVFPSALILLKVGNDHHLLINPPKTSCTQDQWCS
jgi:MFS family permease